MLQKKCGLLLLLLVLIFIPIGCSSCGAVKNTDGTIAVQTPLQRVIKLNAEIAKSNLAVEQTAESLHRTGVITDAQTRPIIRICLTTAQASDTIRVVTASPAEWDAVASKILNTLDSLGLDRQIRESGMTNPQILTLLQAMLETVNLIKKEVVR